MNAAFLYLATGVAAGLMAGLLGVGGGLIVVPVLAFHFAHAYLTGEHLMHLAIGTSLATIAVTALSSVVAHHRRAAVDWGVVKGLTPGLIVGALSGAAVAGQLATGSLQRLFGVFELVVAVQIGFAVQPTVHRLLPKGLGLGAAGGVIGLVSALLGIGGGTLTVPFLLWCGVSIRRAVAISAACGLPIAVAGAAGFVAGGWHAPGLPAGSTGYIYWPAFLGIAAASVLFAPLGARLAHTIPKNLLRRIFAGFLLLAGLKMLLG